MTARPLTAAASAGGVITFACGAADGFTTDVTNSTSTTKGGAAIHGLGGSVTVINATFTNNQCATTGQDVAGGAKAESSSTPKSLAQRGILCDIPAADSSAEKGDVREGRGFELACFERLRARADGVLRHGVARVRT